MAEKKEKGNGIVRKLRSMVGSDAKAYYILFRYCPELLPNKNIKTFQDLFDNYACFKNGNTEEYCNTWLVMDEGVQRGVKWLKGRLHQQRILELYDKFYEKAKEGDVPSFKAITSFSKEYFVDDKEDDVAAFLQGVSLPKDYEDKSE